MATVISVNPNVKNQYSSPVLSPVILNKIYLKMQPKKTPMVTRSCAYDPRVPLISVGDSSFIIRGATEL